MTASEIEQAGRCLVHGCENHRRQGAFVDGMCRPCYEMLRTGVAGPGKSFVHRLARLGATLTEIAEYGCIGAGDRLCGTCMPCRAREAGALGAWMFENQMGTGWIVNNSRTGRVLHFSTLDGWEVQKVVTAFP